MKPDIDTVYAVLRRWAKQRKPQTYTDLSRAYQSETGDWFEPHGSWDAVLGELNRRLSGVGAPALSAVVVLRATNEPGAAFWGCAPNVPPRPKSDDDRLAEWTRIVNEIETYPWPEKLP